MNFYLKKDVESLEAYYYQWMNKYKQDRDYALKAHEECEDQLDDA